MFRQAGFSKSKSLKPNSSEMIESSRNYTLYLYYCSKMDPFVVLELGTLKLKTKTAKDGGKNPKWLEVQL
jgi:hypothetical protein